MKQEIFTSKELTMTSHLTNLKQSAMEVRSIVDRLTVITVVAFSLIIMLTVLVLLNV